MSHQTIVFFDLETTGLDTSECEIIQLSAICGEKTFNAYILPSDDLDEAVTRVTGLSVHYGVLHLHQTPVHTIPLHEALTSFLVYLCSFPGPILLAAHNAKCFDAVVLTRVLQQSPVGSEFQKVVSGYLDTLPLSRKVFPDLESHSLSSLVEHFLKDSFGAHNAEEDARVLQDLFKAWNLGKCTYSECVYSPESFVATEYSK